MRLTYSEKLPERFEFFLITLDGQQFSSIIVSEVDDDEGWIKFFDFVLEEDDRLRLIDGLRIAHGEIEIVPLLEDHGQNTLGSEYGMKLLRATKTLLTTLNHQPFTSDSPAAVS